MPVISDKNRSTRVQFAMYGGPSSHGWSDLGWRVQFLHVWIWWRCPRSSSGRLKIQQNYILPSVKHWSGSCSLGELLWIENSELRMGALVHIEGHRQELRFWTFSRITSFLGSDTLMIVRSSWNRTTTPAHEQSSQGLYRWEATACTCPVITKPVPQSYKVHVACGEKSSRMKISHKQAGKAGTPSAWMDSRWTECSADIGEEHEKQMWSCRQSQ